jgi:hypothetical protein
MTAEAQISRTIDEAFRAAYLLSGSSEIAENAVLAGIAALDVTGVAVQTLIVESAKAAIRQRPRISRPWDRASSNLSRELQRLTLLEPGSRDCFVLRVLYRMTPEICCAILNLTLREFEDSLCAAYQALPFIEAGRKSERHRSEGMRR